MIENVLIGVIAFLCILMMVQQMLFMIHTQKLVNKLMARDFPEYAATAKPNLVEIHRAEVQEKFEDDDLNQLNNLLM